MQKPPNKFSTNLLKGIQHRLRAITTNKYKKAGLNWFSEKKLKHLPPNQEHTFNLKGHPVSFKNGPDFFHSLVEIFAEEVYKTTFNTSSPYIIDCGSNIGLSVLYFTIHHPGAEIDAYEPDPSNFAKLEGNVPGSEKVRLHNEAIWKENTTLSFIHDGTLGSKIGNSEDLRTVQVKAKRLKDLLNRKVDFLKLDIEGAEYEVLKDCAEELKQVDQLFIEYHGFFNKMNELTEIFQLVEKSGFAFYIKEATSVYATPFYRTSRTAAYDVQLNIFCFRTKQ